MDDVEAVVLFQPLENLAGLGDCAIVAVVEPGRGEAGGDEEEE